MSWPEDPPDPPDDLHVDPPGPDEPDGADWYDADDVAAVEYLAWRADRDQPVRLDPDAAPPSPTEPDAGEGADDLEETAPPSAIVRRLFSVPNDPDDPDTDRAGMDGFDDLPGENSRAGATPWGHTPQELADALATVLTHVQDLAGQVQDLTGLVAEGADAEVAEPGRHARYRYERHPPARVAAAQAALDGWVRWLVGAYQLTDTVPPCWARHDALAEELAGLYVAWQATWADKARYDAAVGWHEQLAKALDGRLTGWLRGARCGQQCVLDHELADADLTRWEQRAADSRGGDYRQVRARRFAPPITKARPKPPRNPAAASAPRTGKGTAP